MNQIVEIDTNGMQAVSVGDDLFENRCTSAEASNKTAEVTIWLQAYNRLEKTKRAVESVLRYTNGIDYELLLVDNGSTDDTLAYFQSVPFEKKRIIHVSKNVGSAYPNFEIKLSDIGRFFVILANDLIVTEHWLDNLLTCIKSDSRIGMVNPVCNNTSNLQQVELPYKSYEEMQQQAARFNRSDPRKWEDRQRLITLGTVVRKEVLLAMGWPLGDFGFFHDFVDDDITFAIRRLGYRTVLVGDTWICHDHDYRHGEGKDPAEFQKSLDIGRRNFCDKYFGVDAWDDVNNYLIPYLDHFPTPCIKGDARVLGIDTRCGTPILDIKNWLRKFGVFNTVLSAFTQDPKYWVDLKTICHGPVICDREEFLIDSFPRDFFDYVIMDRPFNRYHEPQKILNDVFALCKKGGYVVCKLKNTATFQEYANALGQRDVYDSEFSYNIPLEVANQALKQIGEIEALISIPFQTTETMKNALDNLLPAEIEKNERGELIYRMLCNEFLFLVRKK